MASGEGVSEETERLPTLAVDLWVLSIRESHAAHRDLTDTELQQAGSRGSLYGGQLQGAQL